MGKIVKNKKESTIPGYRNRRFGYQSILAARESEDGEIYLAVDWEPSEVTLSCLISDGAMKDAKAVVENNCGKAAWQRGKKFLAAQDR